MNDAIKCLVLVGCVLASSCQTTLRPTTDFDDSVDFSRYQTFSWIDTHPLVLAATQRPLSPLVEQRLMNDAKDALTGRGLRFVEDPLDADLVVAFTIGSREGVRITSYPTTSMRRGPRGRPAYTWGGHWDTRNVVARQYTEGQLAIDLFDVAEARPVWHGTVSTQITRRDRAEPDATIQAAVAAILAKFPPG
jgi:hypothetical protein